MEGKTNKLQGMSDIRRYFHRLERPVFFVSATNFNLAGMEEWVRHFYHINYIDCYDGRNPRVFSPSEIAHDEFESIEQINNYLLAHRETHDFIKRVSRGQRPIAVFLMFDEETERLCELLGMDVWFPKAALRTRCDNKMETVRIGNKAGVPSAPNALARVASYEQLRDIAWEHKLGDRLVVQTAFGDSGHTTFFIDNADDFAKHADEIVGEAEVKIMRRINCRGSTLEACTTKRGTIVGPLLTEVVGAPELTPYKGGWCGNEVFADAFTQEVRDKARDYAFKFGEQLRKEGYRGYFDLDFLIDVDTGEVYLGELNPRICGASPMTNHAAFAHADAPLFLFHLLEFADVEFELDVDALNQRWSNPEYIDSWCQLVVKHVPDSVDRVTSAPESGIWRIDESGRIQYVRMDLNRQSVAEENEAFFLRITGAGDYRYEGADLGILISRGRVMDEQHRLNARAKAWIDALNGQYAGAPLLPDTAPALHLSAGNFKIL